MRTVPPGGGIMIGLMVSAAMWVAFALTLFGCAGTPKSHKYSWGRIVRADGNALAAFCSSDPGRWDDGSEKRRWAPVAGCFDPATGDVWIEDSCAGAKAIPHELAHKDGIEDPDSEGYEW